MSTPGETSAAPEQGAAAPPHDRREVALEYLLAKAGIKLLGDAVKTSGAILRASRQDGTPVLAETDRESAFLAGLRLGAVLMKRGAVTVILDNTDPLFVAWVKDHPKYHTEIREVVEPAFAKRLKDHARKVGKPIAPTGEMVPGMSIDVGDPTPTEELVDDWADVLAHAIASGALDPGRLFPLPPAAPAPALEEGPQ
ncbi:hypothetical protein ACIHFD_49240 [Nonomuraea sp. NPDC051941]|uniref:hypothetical protein n=1 Tax=Nonomuraea sp. NPDC051941 TaxID=3364373 RepID=UPI0037C8C503